MMAQIMVGNMWTLLMSAAVPRSDLLFGYSLEPLKLALSPLAAAIGEYIYIWNSPPPRLLTFLDVASIKTNILTILCILFSLLYDFLSFQSCMDDRQHWS